LVYEISELCFILLGVLFSFNYQTQLNILMDKIVISIIISTRNREQILWDTVQKACNAIEKKNVEIIVINDGDKVLCVPNFLKGEIKIFDNPKKGVSSARNFGVSQAKGSILFFIDDDMWINNAVIDWINDYIIQKGNTEEVYFINWNYPTYLNEKLRISKVGRYLLAANYHNLWGRMQKKTEQPSSGLYKYDQLGSCSLVMKKDIFNKVGCYNENIIFSGEDSDLANKINKLDIPIYVVFDVTLHHNHLDRIEIHNFLKRIYDGFGSEFIAKKTGIMGPVPNITYNGFKLLVFDFFRNTEKAWIFLHIILPNSSFIQPLQNKLIGGLGGLQRFKQWRKIIKKSQ